MSVALNFCGVRGHMGKVTLLLIAIISALSAPVGNSRVPDAAEPEPQVSENALTRQASAIHLTIKISFEVVP